jgi:hypothetical protein
MLPRKRLQGGGLFRRKPHLLARALFLLVHGAALGPPCRQNGRPGKAFQFGAPKVLCAWDVLLPQPGNVIAETTLATCGQFSPRQNCFVSLQNFPQQQRHRPAIEQYVMMRPDESIGFVSHPQEREAHQRRLAQLECTPPVFAQKRAQQLLLLGGRESTPILFFPAVLILRIERLAAAGSHFPDEGGA